MKDSYKKEQKTWVEMECLIRTEKARKLKMIEQFQKILEGQIEAWRVMELNGKSKKLSKENWHKMKYSNSQMKYH
jgi:hypothetical protein